MGRMLEALTLATQTPTRPPDRTGDLRPYAPEPAAECAEEREEEVPFIEVGAPDKKIEGSATVMGQQLDGALKTTAPCSPLPAPPLSAPTSANVPWSVQFRPRYGEVGRTARKPSAELVALYQPEHKVSVDYRNVLNELTAHLPFARSQVLLFSATAPRSGTTTVLLNLAITAAREGKRRVAVVDANVHRPAIAERLCLASAPGLREVLTRAVPLTHVLQQTMQANVFALTIGRNEAAHDLWLPVDGLAGMFRQLRESFDHVFVDAPAWPDGREAPALSALCDATYLVIHQPEAPANLPQPANLHGYVVTGLAG